MSPFIERWLAIREKWHLKNHPFFAAWENGKLTMEQMCLYVVQNYQITRHFFRQIPACMAKAPIEVRRLLAENLAEEFGLLGIGEHKGVDHDDLQLAFCDAAGLPRERMLHGEFYPHFQALGYYFWNLVYNEPWQVFMAAGGACESQNVEMHRKSLTGLIRYHGFKPGDPAIGFFEEHVLADTEHGRRALQILDEHVKSPELQAECLKATETAVQLFWYALNECERYIIKGQREPVPA